MYFQEIVELRSFEVLQDDINGIFSLVDSLQSHDVAVTESSHQFDLILKRFAALIPSVLFLFREGLHSHQAVISQSLSEVDSGECSLSDLLLSLEQFMEISLIDASLQLQRPQLYDCCLCCEGELLRASLSFKPDGPWCAELSFLLNL